jgi:histidyl-tRNA synthetase
VLKVSNRKLMNAALAAAGVTSERQTLAVLRAVDKFDKFGVEGVKLLLGTGRLDESGDFTKGAELASEGIDAVLQFLGAEANSRSAQIAWLDGVVGAQAVGQEALAELARIDAVLTGMGVAEDQVVFDPSIVRGLEYYTGPVFEAELLLQTLDEKGETVRFGSVGGGGRYDDLVARFTGQSVPATGFSFGVSRLAAALRAAGRDPAEAARGPVVVIAFSQDHMADYFSVAGELRASGLPAEVYLGGSGMKAQMKYADRRLSPAAVIIGDDERAAGTVTVKDLDLGRALAAKVTDNAAWRTERPGQATIPRGDLVAFIRNIVG